MLQLILQFNILKSWSNSSSLATEVKVFTFCIANSISRIFKPVVIYSVLFFLNSPGISENCSPSLSSISKLVFEILIACTVFKKMCVD